MEIKQKLAKFNQQQLPVFIHNDKPYVAMKPICENIGLDWEAQRQRIKRNHVLNLTACMIKVVTQDGKAREVLALPIGYLNGWLLGVDANKVKPEIKETLIKYQLECYDVLYKHFMPKPVKPVDLSNYVLKDQHDKLVLKYHRQFRQYDDMIDTMRSQVENMERKCRRYDFKMARGAISIEDAATALKVPVSKIRKVLEDEYIIEERCTYVESNKSILKVTERGKAFDLIFIQNDIINGDVKEVIMINEDGIAYLQGRV
ncbi:phage antirepressor N-terminal domain-containing protein [Acinetobacter ursingii]|uniref:phage antirepressor N-terminal domain-containing protein n=1 Tax=Acinetobacter ursingii TaxID=108980 RepID=UPI00124ECA04|nr:phage antirepressor N-terminal domain-containing protein [Acinetobacter ursingii]